MSDFLDRRAFLRSCGVASLSLPVVGSLLSACAPAEEDLSAVLIAPLHDLPSARFVGGVYLNDVPEERDLEVLIQRIAGADEEAWRALARQNRSALHAAVKARHHADFAAGKVVYLRDWQLSQTEARLYALAALS